MIHQTPIAYSHQIEIRFNEMYVGDVIHWCGAWLTSNPAHTWKRFQSKDEAIEALLQEFNNYLIACNRNGSAELTAFLAGQMQQPVAA